ncbi:MAG: molybdate ABC transporter substrate-binding protein [Gammaproteobacteria bacterium]
MILTWLALLVGAGLPPARADEATVAVAANFAEVLAALAPAFTATTGHTLVASAGSTGKLYAQVMSGAPFDVLLAADPERPARLEAEGVAVAGTRFTYATGALVLWSRDAALLAADDPAVIAASPVRHLAIANPDLAPYGVAARQVLAALGLAAAVADKLVMGQNVGEAYALVASGAAEAGFVALSAVAKPGTPVAGSRWAVPATLHDPIRQDAVLLRHGADNRAARAFLDFLRSASARALIRAHGYRDD